MRRHALMTAFFLLMIGPVVYGAQYKAYSWGGPGFDPAQKNTGQEQSRYLVRYAYNDPERMLFIVDREETANGVGRIELMSSDGSRKNSQYCIKFMRHPTGPYACFFPAEEVLKQTGEGALQIFDRSGNFLLEDRINFDDLKQRLK